MVFNYKNGADCFFFTSARNLTPERKRHNKPRRKTLSGRRIQNQNNNNI